MLSVCVCVSAAWWIWLGVAVLIFSWFVFNIACWVCHAYLSRESSSQSSANMHTTAVAVCAA
jgi:hypothetical protein